MLDKLLSAEVLRCPECAERVRIVGERLECEGCSARAPVKNGVPLFTNQEIGARGTDTTPEKAVLGRLRKRLPFLAELRRRVRPPSFARLRRGEDRLEHFIGQAAGVPEALIVDIGAGRKRAANVVALDLYDHPGIGVCANADALPFADASVDMVISRSALEHMSNFNGAIHEMQRVLKPGGLLLVVVPFIYPYHPEPHDLARWSHVGLAQAFDTCERIESGSYRGPHATMYRLLTSYSAWATSFGVYPLQVALETLYEWAFLPLKVADVLYGRYRPATPLDSAVYFVGRRRNQAAKCEAIPDSWGQVAA